mgnify:CR=1 FL=1|jgi:hypothetical protein
MNFLKKWLSPKQAPTEKNETLLEWLNRNDVIYEMKDTDIGYKIIYSDVFDKKKFEIVYDGKKYIVNGKNTKEKDIKTLLEKQIAIDSNMEEFMYGPENEKLIQIYEFLKKTFPEEDISFDLTINENNELELLYTSSGKDIPLVKILNENKVMYDIKTKKPIDHNEAIILILEQIMRDRPLLFESGDFKVPEETPFTDIVKQYIVNKSLVERLNKTKHVEAKLIMGMGNSSIFIIFRNGAALEYIHPTKQRSGQIVIIDVDEDTTLEDNEEYWMIKQILKLPDLLNNKPDGEKLPTLKFDNKKSLRLK